MVVYDDHKSDKNRRDALEAIYLREFVISFFFLTLPCRTDELRKLRKEIRVVKRIKRDEIRSAFTPRRVLRKGKKKKK